MDPNCIIEGIKMILTPDNLTIEKGNNLLAEVDTE